VRCAAVSLVTRHAVTSIPPIVPAWECESAFLAQAVIAAWNALDRDAFVKLQHPEVEMTLPRNVLEGGSYRGHEGVRRAFNDAVES